MILRFSELPLVGLGRLAFLLDGWMEGGGGYMFEWSGVGWGDCGEGKGKGLGG